MLNNKPRGTKSIFASSSLIAIIGIVDCLFAQHRWHAGGKYNQLGAGSLPQGCVDAQSLPGDKPSLVAGRDQSLKALNLTKLSNLSSIHFGHPAPEPTGLWYFHLNRQHEETCHEPKSRKALLNDEKTNGRGVNC